MFVDRVEIEVEGGRGGNGCVSFRREKYVPRGGPDGGDGGQGGHVVIRARHGVDNLTALAHRKFWRASKGTHGMGSNRRGRDGGDLVIEVPPGTVVMDSELHFVMKDLTNDGESFVAARGGKGGKGNSHFKSAVNQTPREHTPGEDGELRRLVLELKSIADVGLIGKPNAGKSTLLSRMTRARPEIAAYPFTTKHPNLGRVVVDLDRSFIMADIPGLIEGAHDGVGLGHEFLKHVERAGILVHLVEPAPVDGSDPIGNYHVIRDELLQYQPQMADRPELICVSKAELPEADEVVAALATITGKEVLKISAVTGVGLNHLSQKIFETLPVDERRA